MSAASLPGHDGGGEGKADGANRADAGDGGDFLKGHTIVDFFSAKEGENLISVGSRPHEDEYAYWDGFVDGAAEVLEKVEPLL